MKLGETTLMCYSVPEFKGSEIIEFPNTSQRLVKVAEQLRVPEEDQYMLPEITAENMPLLVSMFTIYPDFGPYYDSYIIDPDANVKPVESYDIPQTGVRQAEPTIQDVKITCHILLLLMAKTFTTEKEEKTTQIDIYLKSRIMAARSSINSIQGSILFNKSKIDEMNNLWNIFPKLKESIFYWALTHSKSGEISAARLLLANSQMTTIMCISTFINSEIKSVAHTYPIIWEETVKFLDAYNMIKEKMGQTWIYYRILDSKDTTLANRNFPNLARASVEFNKAFIDKSDSFKRVVVPNLPCQPGIVDAAKKEDKGEYYQKGGAFKLTSVQEEDARRLGIDLKQFLGTERARKEILAEDDVLSIMARMMNRKPGPSDG